MHDEEKMERPQKEGWDNDTAVTYTMDTMSITLAGYEAREYGTKFTIEEYGSKETGYGYFTIIHDTGDGVGYIVGLMQTDNTKYDYSDDYEKIVDHLTITPKDSSDEQENSSASQSGSDNSEDFLSDATTEQKNAYESAKNYVNLMAFSKQELIDQLTSEYADDFSEEDAQWAVDHLDVDWKEEALESAQNYIDYMSFSQQGLYDQLTSEYGSRFTDEEAQYAIDNVDADWNEEALEAAKTYYEDMSMSKEDVYDQLISEYGEQFTTDQAQYAIDHLDD